MNLITCMIKGRQNMSQFVPNFSRCNARSPLVTWPRHSKQVVGGVIEDACQRRINIIKSTQTSDTASDSNAVDNSDRQML